MLLRSIGGISQSTHSEDLLLCCISCIFSPAFIASVYSHRTLSTWQWKDKKTSPQPWKHANNQNIPKQASSNKRINGLNQAKTSWVKIRKCFKCYFRKKRIRLRRKCSINSALCLVIIRQLFREWGVHIHFCLFFWCILISYAQRLVVGAVKGVII